MPQGIEDYALIGDLRTAALVGRDGSIDWLALPRFDSPAVYAALLGDAENGRWALAPVRAPGHSRRRYHRDTLVLETEWITARGAVRVSDFMPPHSPTPQVVRVVEGLMGAVRMRTVIAPRMGYGRTVPNLHPVGTRLLAEAEGEAVWVASEDVALAEADGAWTGDFTVAAGERVSFTLGYAERGAANWAGASDARSSLAETEKFWVDWTSRSTYSGPWETEVKQSLVLLKALTYAPTGGILAAATTSLPEQVGGSRNWDYRYVWLRDASFTINAFLAAGYVDEAAEWTDWLVRTVADDPTHVQIMYGVDGSPHLPEQTLEWLPGHAGSAPVRVGNEAAGQQQNDVWGEVLDALDAAVEAGVRATPEVLELQRLLLAHLEQSWREPDNGLWEVRGARRHFVHSKLLSWVGVDRAIRSREAEGSDERLAELRTLRSAIKDDVLERGYSEPRRAFTQSYGSAELDASVLLMPRYGLLPWTDPRMLDTIDAIQEGLTRDGLVLRYTADDGGANVDGIPGSEGVFLASSFWLADALHESGRVEEAAALFERLLSLRNDVGLLSEEYDTASGRHLGNTPQAFSHAGVVTTALRLSRQPASAAVPVPAAA